MKGGWKFKAVCVFDYEKQKSRINDIRKENKIENFRGGKIMTLRGIKTDVGGFSVAQIISKQWVKLFWRCMRRTTWYETFIGRFNFITFWKFCFIQIASFFFIISRQFFTLKNNAGFEWTVLYFIHLFLYHAWIHISIIFYSFL